MTDALDFRMNASSESDVIDHLCRCDRQFAPRLSARVDIPAYAKKIRANAQTFEAWSGDTMVGLVAAYMNPAKSSCYISSVSVIENFRRHGIAERLLAACLDHAKAAGLESTSLEVGEQSHAALGLYMRFGFRTTENRAGMLLMTCVHAESPVIPCSKGGGE